MLLFDFLLQESDSFGLIVQHYLILAVDFGLVILFATVYADIQTRNHIVHSFIKLF